MLFGIKNARIVFPDEIQPGCILYDENGIIRFLGKGISGISGVLKENLTDAHGAVAVPGGVDAHVHFGGFGDVPILDDFASGSRGAIAGGTTTVIDFCESFAGESVSHCIERRMKDAKFSLCDYLFHFVLTKDYRNQLSEIGFLRDSGISDFKLFTTYENENLTYDEIEEIVSFFDHNQDEITFLVHSEDERFIRPFADLSPDERKDMKFLPECRPKEAESTAVRRLSCIAKRHGANICIAHATTKEAVSVREKENALTLETCPHYLEFTDDVYSGEDGCLYTMTPPLRKNDDREALWNALKSESVSILSTDHCPYSEKVKRNHGLDCIPFGVDGVETRMLYLYSEGVRKRKLSWQQFVRLTSENAARFYHLYPRKGCLAPGSDADIVLIEPDDQTEIRCTELHSSSDYSIYEGRRLRGKIKAVYKQGKQLYDGHNVSEIMAGKYLGEKTNELL